MKQIFFAACVVLFASAILAQNKSEARRKSSNSSDASNGFQLIPEKSPDLQTLVNRAAEEAIAKFAEKKLLPENLAITLIDLSDQNNPKQADFRGEQPIYPASVVKMFYLAATHRWLADGKLKDTPELRRALKDMIVDSSNDATHQIVDVLTEATGGGELSEKELVKWAKRRNAVNRYFASLGYQNINVNQKTYCEDLYGRERQFWNAGKNRNKLTTNATARLLAEIALGKSVSADHSREMMELLKRDQFKESKDTDSQDLGFTGLALKRQGVKLWSKAGWTSKSRHDAAYIETPEGGRFVLVTFTENFAAEREIIPTVARTVLEELGKVK
ncbi:MAG TPA: serine hydrolase [Pyrinomonadaceae bacterium]|nr:serine hydrolase [Pyrinomonadaceae bacterium]